jgi:hypothetical protein
VNREELRENLRPKSFEELEENERQLRASPTFKVVEQVRQIIKSYGDRIPLVDLHPQLPSWTTADEKLRAHFYKIADEARQRMHDGMTKPHSELVNSQLHNLDEVLIPFQRHPAMDIPDFSIVQRYNQRQIARLNNYSYDEENEVKQPEQLMGIRKRIRNPNPRKLKRAGLRPTDL